MLYRVLGKTGLRVSQLGFGAMRLPMQGEGTAARVDRDKAIPMIYRAFEGGVNYIDTAVMYCNDDSQWAVGEALKGWRDKVILSTKNHYFGEDEGTWRRNLENSLERLQTSHIDIYNTHGINWKSYCTEVEPRVGKWMRKALDEGLIKHICTSFHDNNEALLKLADTGYADVITLQYNLLDRELEEGIGVLHAKGIGVIVMGPVGGGRLGASSEILQSINPEIRRVPELALRFVLANPNVSIALSGMSTIEQVEENLRIADSAAALTEGDRNAMDAQLSRLKAMADLYCTGCKYCVPCPSDINIPRIFQMYNEARVYGLWDHAKKSYARMCESGEEGQQPADACVDCGECLSKCPQSIPIPDQLREAATALRQEKDAESI